MKIISHRGNIDGPNPKKENQPLYIDKAIRLGFDVEVDVRYIDGKLYLGHDGPELFFNIPVDLNWFFKRRDSLWIHCKNLSAAYKLATNLKCFCSVSDPFCFITQGYLWLNDLEIEPKNNCIVPLLSIDDIKRYTFMDKPWGICTDYPNDLRRYSS